MLRSLGPLGEVSGFGTLKALKERRGVLTPWSAATSHRRPSSHRAERGRASAQRRSTKPPGVQVGAELGNSSTRGFLIPLPNESEGHRSGVKCRLSVHPWVRDSQKRLDQGRGGNDCRGSSGLPQTSCVALNDLLLSGLPLPRAVIRKDGCITT